MLKSKKLSKVVAILSILTMVFTVLPLGNVVNAAGVYLSIKAPSANVIREGGTVSFQLNYTGDVAHIALRSGDVTPNGFTGSVSVTGSGNSRTVTISNVKSVGSSKSITVTGGTAASSTGALANPITSSSFTIAAQDIPAPVLTLSGPSTGSIYAGQTVSFTATYTGDVAHIALRSGDVTPNGFTADVSISGAGNTRTITLSNVQGAVGGNKTITVTGGTATNSTGKLANPATSGAFSIAQKNQPAPNPTPNPNPTPTPAPTPDNKPADWIPNPNTGR